MVKRNVSIALWTLSGWVAGGALALALGLPSLLAPALAIAAGAFVGFGPVAYVWTGSSKDQA